MWRFGVELPVARAYGMARSPDGYLWLGAREGLVRFDGIRFVVLGRATTPALRTPSAATGAYSPMLVDRERRLWIGRPDGALLTYADGAFHVVLPPGPGGVTYTRIYEDGARRLWVKLDSANREHIREFVGGRLVPNTWPADAPDSDVFAAARDTADGMWVGTRARGLWHVTPRGAERVPVAIPAGGGSMGQALYPYPQTQDGTLWIATMIRRAQRLQGRAGAPNPLRGTSIHAIAEASDGTVYVGTRGRGVLRMRGDVVEPQMLDDDLASPSVEELVLDDAGGTLWALTDAGLERFRRPAFVALDRADGLPAGFRPTNLAADASGALWTLDDVARRLVLLDRGTVRGERGPVRARTAALPPGLECELLGPARGGGVWFAPRVGGLGRIRGFGAGTITWFARDAALAADRFWAGTEAIDGTLWLAPTRGGVGTLRAGHYRHLSLPDSAQGSFVSVAADDAGQVVAVTLRPPPHAYWLTAAGGSRPIAMGSVAAGWFSPVLAGGDTVWAIADADGSTLVRLTGGRASQVRLRHREPALAVGRPVLVAAGGALWFFSRAGIGRFSRAALDAAADGRRAPPEPQLFGAADGLAAPRVNSPAWTTVARTRDGRIWATTAAGLVVVDPVRVPVDPSPPVVRVEEVEIAGHVLGRDTLPAGAPLRVAPNPGRVELHYTALEVRNPERVRLQYRLDGVDRTWQTGGGTRVATYTQLRPGRYDFRVRAWNEEGTPSAREATLGVWVLPAWYQTWWAELLGMAAVAAAGGVGTWAVARARQRRTEAELRATMAERARVARELHDTLLGSLTGVAMQLDAATARAAGPAGNDAGALAFVRDQTYRALADARRSVTDLRAPGADGPPLSALIDAAAQRIFSGTNVDVRVQCVGVPRRFEPALETEVLRIVVEAMTNASKHAACRYVVATCTFDRRGLRVRIRDDGRGFDPGRAAPAGHWGIVGMRERAAAIGARFALESTPNGGTDVMLAVRHR